MCRISSPSPPPAPEPIPEPTPQVSNAVTSRDAPALARTRDADGDVVGKSTSTSARKRLGRGVLRIPLTSSGLSSAGLNFPTS